MCTMTKLKGGTFLFSTNSQDLTTKREKVYKATTKATSQNHLIHLIPPQLHSTFSATTPHLSTNHRELQEQQERQEEDEHGDEEEKIKALMN